MLRERIAIPKHTIEINPDKIVPHIPKPDDLESGIIYSIKAQFRTTGPIISEGLYKVVSLDNPQPHHYDPDIRQITLWVYNQNRQKPDEIPLWGDNSWEEVSRDHDFLTALDSYLDNLQYLNPTVPYRIYFFIGFVLPGEDIPDTVYRRGLQSQIRWHIHIVNPIEGDHMYQQILVLDEPDHNDRHAYTQIINEAGVRSQEYFYKELADLGNPFTYQQLLGRNNHPVSLEHTMYGFNTLEDALKQCLFLRGQIKQSWLPHSKEIYGPFHDKISDIGLICKQSFVPNFGIIKPSIIDRQNGKTDDNYRYWVIPLSVSGGQSMLTPGGVFLYRNQLPQNQEKFAKL